MDRIHIDPAGEVQNSLHLNELIAFTNLCSQEGFLHIISKYWRLISVSLVYLYTVLTLVLFVSSYG